MTKIRNDFQLKILQQSYLILLLVKKDFLVILCTRAAVARSADLTSSDARNASEVIPSTPNTERFSIAKILNAFQLGIAQFLHFYN